MGHTLEPLRALGGGGRQSRAVHGKGGEPRERDEGLLAGLVDDVRRRPAEPDRSERNLDALADDDKGQVRADERRAVSQGRGPVERRGPAVSGDRERVQRIGDIESEPRGGVLVHPVNGRQLKTRTIRIRHEDGTERRRERRVDCAQHAVQRALEVAVRHGLDGARKRDARIG